MTRKLSLILWLAVPFPSFSASGATAKTFYYNLTAKNHSFEDGCFNYMVEREEFFQMPMALSPKLPKKINQYKKSF